MNEHSQSEMSRVWIGAVIALAVACGGQSHSQNSSPEASATAQLADKEASPDWSPPVNLDSPINSVDNEFHPALSSDGLTFYFAGRRTHDVLASTCDTSPTPLVNYGGNDLYFATRDCLDPENCPWTTPTNMGPIINGSGDESGPFPSADGKCLYFASRSHDGFGGADIFRTCRSDTTDPCGWGSPENLGLNVNTGNNDADPCLAYVNGTTVLFFARSKTPDGQSGAQVFDIYASIVDPVGAFGQGKAVNVSDPNNPNIRDAHPTIYNNSMVFSSNRPGSLGTCSVTTNQSCTANTDCPTGETCRFSIDLWMSFLPQDSMEVIGGWSTPVNLGATVNTTSIERAPFAWPDRRAISICTLSPIAQAGTGRVIFM